MAAFNYDDFTDPSEGGLVQSIVNWGGAFLSILLIAGLATWGWKLWQRDVTGIPVVRALEGPMRVAPEEPGGMASEYQGLAVNRIAEEREEELVDRVVLAPAPAALDEAQDLTVAELQPVIEPEAAPEPVPLIETEDAVALVEDDALVAIEPEPAIATAPTPSATDLAVAAALEGIDLSETVAMLTPASLSVPQAIPRPLGRPSGVKLTSVTPVMNDVTGDIDPNTIPPGTRLVQLGAFDTPDDARGAWDRIAGRFDGLMVDKTQVIVEAKAGGREFWRLRAMGFADLSEARRFCAALVAERTDCIPVVAK